MGSLFEPNSITELPFGFPGRVYRSPMPFRAGDEGDLLDAYQITGIGVVVVLAPREEYLRKTNRDLLKVYQTAGIKSVELPIEDFSTPALQQLDEAISQVIAYAQAGENIAVHCYAGMGRTGTFLACMAVRALSLRGPEAIKWVREYVPPALENDEQIQFVVEYGERYAHHER